MYKYKENRALNPISSRSVVSIARPIMRPSIHHTNDLDQEGYDLDPVGYDLDQVGYDLDQVAYVNIIAFKPTEGTERVDTLRLKIRARAVVT